MLQVMSVDFQMLQNIYALVDTKQQWLENGILGKEKHMSQLGLIIGLFYQAKAIILILIWSKWV